MSADYIKRLEQGRARPSLQVLKAVARALALSRAEYEHLCILTGHAAAQPGQVNRLVGPSTRRLLDRLGDVPVAIFDAAWALLACNALGTALCGDPSPFTGRDRNMVWRCFTNVTDRVPESRRQAERYRAGLVAELRETASRYPSDRDLTALITALHRASALFTELWHGGVGAKLVTFRRVIDHPDVGSITTDGNVLRVPEGDLRLLVYTAEPGSPDADRLAAIRPLTAAAH